jgi:hypothetical protein
MKRSRMALLSFVAAAGLLIPATAHAAAGGTTAHPSVAAADSVTPFSGLAYGASTLTGQIIWSDRGVQIGATLKAVSNAKSAEFLGSNGNLTCFFDEPRSISAGKSLGIGFPKHCAQAGGFGEVDVFLENGAGDQTLHWDLCTRSKCTLEP